MINYDGAMAFSELNKLPNIHAVYVIFANETVLYVGIAYCLRHRIMQHKYNKLMIKHGANCVRWIKNSESNCLLKTQEMYLIKTLKPKLNKTAGSEGNLSICSYSSKRNTNYENKNTYYDVVYNLVWDVIEKSPSKVYGLNSIVDGTGLSYSWLYIFSRGLITNAKITKLDLIYSYLDPNKNQP